MRLNLRIFVFMLFLMIVFSCGCQDEELEKIYSGVGYISGWFVGWEVGPDGVGTGEQTKVGYCIWLENSEDEDIYERKGLYTFDFPDTLFRFPDADPLSKNNIDNGGPGFFPDSLRLNYRFRFSAKTVAESEKVNFVMFSHPFLQPFPWENYEEVRLMSFSIE